MTTLQSVIRQKLDQESGKTETLWRRTTTYVRNLNFARACESPFCVAVAVALVVSVVLLILQPPMLMRQCQRTGKQYLSKLSLLLFSILAGVCVFMVCIFCGNNSGGGD